MSILQLAHLLKNQNHKLATAESCTGGLLSAYCTNLPGSSLWFDRALVTYSNEAKQFLLGVSTETLTKHGAVSEACVLEMAQGLLRQEGITLGVSISGIAGPDGGSPDKPVGTVWFGFAMKNQAPFAILKNFPGDRVQIREAACAFAIEELTRMVS